MIRLTQLLAAINPGTIQTDLTDIDTKYRPITSLNPAGYLKTGVNLVLAVAGILAFFYLLWGGIQWIVAGGDKEATEKARKKITSALIGLAIVFSAYALLFIISALFGVTLLDFSIVRIGT
ncbi:MAG: hypothetical protein AAB697_00235 [Patescibacteria group bacterium]